MKFRRFRTADGRFLDALLTVEGDFSVPAESHRDTHEAGYGVGPLTVVEADTDPWDGQSPLVQRATPRPVPEPTPAEVAAAKVRAIDPSTIADRATRDALAAVKDALLSF